MKNFFFLFALALSVTFAAGCGGNDPVTPDRCNATLFNEDVNPRLTAWQEAATNYANDQSVANCEAYKTTGDAWLEAIRQYESCATLYNESWREAVEEARADLAAIPCN